MILDRFGISTHDTQSRFLQASTLRALKERDACTGFAVRLSASSTPGNISPSVESGLHNLEQPSQGGRKGHRLGYGSCGLCPIGCGPRLLEYRPPSAPSAPATWPRALGTPGSAVKGCRPPRPCMPGNTSPLPKKIGDSPANLLKSESTKVSINPRLPPCSLMDLRGAAPPLGKAHQPGPLPPGELSQ